MTVRRSRPAADPLSGKARRAILILGALAGIALVAIGIRFLVVPGSAAKFFGIDPRAPVPALHYVVALRDIWLGLLAVAFAALREWRALAIWLALGSLVCFADGVIAWTSSGRPWSIAFHVTSGIFCGLLSGAAWRADRA